MTLEEAIRRKDEATRKPTPKVMCAGWLEVEKIGKEWEYGIKGWLPCAKKITTKGAIQMTWTSENQFHDCYFCSWRCLRGFMDWSCWEKEDK